MRCSRAQQMMSAAFDRELAARDGEDLAAHLQACPACGHQFQALQGMHQAWRQVARYSAPAGLTRRVLAGIDTARPQPFLATWWVPFAEALMLLMVIGMGVLSGNLFSNSLGLDNPERGVASLGLEIFDATPRDSLGGAYLAMLEVRHEK